MGNYHLEKRSQEDEALSKRRSGREMEAKSHQFDSTSENKGAKAHITARIISPQEL
jgi:hypothetical protein